MKPVFSSDTLYPKYAALKDQFGKSKLFEHIIREARATGTDMDKLMTLDPEVDAYDYNVVICVLELASTFSGQGHSGHSAKVIIDLFTKLAQYEPLAPLTGAEHEWVDVSEYFDTAAQSGIRTFQNNRSTNVFRELSEDGTVSFHQVGYTVFVDEQGWAFTNDKSTKYFGIDAFPYTPGKEFLNHDGTPYNPRASADDLPVPQQQDEQPR